MSVNILVSIGNSDDKLSQREWSRFIEDARHAIYYAVQAAVALPAAVHGEWFSAPDSPWQNANWCVELVPGSLTYNGLRRAMQELCKQYRQDSIAWTEGPVEFLSAQS